MFFSPYERQRNVQTDTFGANIFSHIISAFGGVSYQFNVQAVTVKPGTNASLTVAIPEYGEVCFNDAISVERLFFSPSSFSCYRGLIFSVSTFYSQKINFIQNI